MAESEPKKKTKAAAAADQPKRKRGRPPKAKPPADVGVEHAAGSSPAVAVEAAPMPAVQVPDILSRPEPESATPAAREPAPADHSEPVAMSPAAAGPAADKSEASPEAPDGGGARPVFEPKPPAADEGGGPWWKRNKQNKKKWMDKQQGRGGPHHPPQAHHPAQPPPPNLTPHYGDLPNPARFADLAGLDALAAELGAGPAQPLRIDELYAFNLADLTARARSLGVAFDGPPNRKQALEALLRLAAEKKIPLLDRGWLDLTDRGHGFIVHGHFNYRLFPESTYIPESLVRRYGLKRGHLVEVIAQAPQPGERCPAVAGVRTVMGGPPGDTSRLLPFEELTPYYPLRRILLEAPVHTDISMRAVDLLTPVGFGQRGLIVAPPRTGKTVLLHNIANSISHNYPEFKLIILLVDERPEEVTDFRRHTRGEVVSSTFDEMPESHVHAAEMVIEKARRLVEAGEHVIILLDSITRLARAYNALASNSGKIMSGGLEATALQKPKRFFGSARNIEGAGSLTILGTALIDTGSRMDEIIFEEFKGTGNMELHLDRGLSDKRIFPAINIDRSGTRKEELIYHPDEMLRVYGLRRAMQGIPPVEAMDMLIQRLKKTKTNAEFLLSLNR
jgi:transcription termination factor Rho